MNEADILVWILKLSVMEPSPIFKVFSKEKKQMYVELYNQ